jgi:gamma-butyrobetaine dioxygenase
VSKINTLEDIKRFYIHYGYIVLHTNVKEPWMLEMVSEQFGSLQGGTFWDKYYEVKYDPVSEPVNDSVALSPAELPLHTDGTFETSPPENVAFQCLQNDIEGFGVSVLVDVWELIKCLAEPTRQVLLEAQFRFQRTGKGVTATVDAPILELKGEDYKVRYRHDSKYSLSPPTKEADLALANFEQVLALKDLQKMVYLNPGDILFVNNHRMLHGRTVLSGTRPRVFRRFWVSAGSEFRP